MAMNVAIYVFKDVEVLDFAGPYEVFTTANRVAQRQRGGAAPFHVFTVSHQDAVCTARAGLSIHVDAQFFSHPVVDVLLVPGGVVSAELEKPPVIDWIRTTDATTTLTASVCTGAFLLAKAGLLEGRTVTTHWEDIADLRAAFPGLQVKADVRWVDQGKYVTSAGISAGIDMSLHLVSRLVDEALAVATARQLEFDWSRNPA